jgi:hypothetical protein
MSAPRISLAQLLFPRFHQMLADLAYETGRFHAGRRLP